MSGWAWDSPKERERVEQSYARMEHQEYIDNHPDYVPSCQCHPLTRDARLTLQELKTAS